MPSSITIRRDASCASLGREGVSAVGQSPFSFLVVWLFSLCMRSANATRRRRTKLDVVWHLIRDISTLIQDSVLCVLYWAGCFMVRWQGSGDVSRNILEERKNDCLELRGLPLRIRWE